MTRIALTPGIERTSADARSLSYKQVAKPLSAELKQSVFERDDFTCQACGFQASKYQDVHFVNGHPEDTRMDNLATLCIFCHQVFHLDRVSAMRSGVLIWLPEVEQTDLHHIARAIYVARISQGPVSDAARAALESLMKKREEARERIGTDDPMILSAVMRDFLTDKAYAVRDHKLNGLRVFPLDRRMIREKDLEFNQFPQILAYWRSKDGPFAGKVPQKWVDFYLEVLSAAGAA